MIIREKLRARLNKEFSEMDMTFNDSELERLYHGHWQRSEGAWSWITRPDSGLTAIGSQFSMSECIKANHWHVSLWQGALSIYPTDEEISDEYDIRGES